MQGEIQHADSWMMVKFSLFFEEFYYLVDGVGWVISKTDCEMKIYMQKEIAFGTLLGNEEAVSSTGIMPLQLRHQDAPGSSEAWMACRDVYHRKGPWMLLCPHIKVFECGLPPGQGWRKAILEVAWLRALGSQHSWQQPQFWRGDLGDGAPQHPLQVEPDYQLNGILQTPDFDLWFKGEYTEAQRGICPILCSNLPVCLRLEC